MNKDKLKDLLLFWSSKEGKNTTLAAYKDRMSEDQPYYYYALRRERGQDRQTAPGGAHPGQGI